MKHIFLKALVVLAALAAAAPSISAQEQNPRIVLEPLFKVPEVPPEYEEIGQRSNYLMARYWDPMDFSQKAVDQYRLNEAVYLWLVPMQWAAKESIEQSVQNLLGKLKKNPGLQLQFVKAAEENLFSPRARLSSDGLYTKFLDALLSNKKVKELRKAKYRVQRKRLEGSSTGMPLANFAYTDRFGVDKQFKAAGVPTIIIFGYPDCDECRLATLRISSDVNATQAAKEKSVAIYYIIPDKEGDWQAALADYPAEWECGAASDLEDELDLRTRPSIYLINSKGEVLEKFLSADQAIAAATFSGAARPSATAPSDK